MGGPSVPYHERTHVTIKSGGTIFFNQKIHRMMGLPKAVFLYYNRPQDTIILEPTEALASNNAFLLKDAGHSGRLIYANPFYKHFGIKVKGTLKFLAPITDSRGRLYLKLSETITVTRGPRQK